MKTIGLFAITTLLVTGCATDGEIDEEQLAAHRAALPSLASLEASSPIASTSSALGDPAIYPSTASDVVTGINGSVAAIVEIMETITDTEPTVYNSDTLEYVWGPYPNDDGVGYMAAYIRDNGEAEDFRYSYALLRGVSNDLATLSPIIWGGATPDDTNDDYGVGITLWDFEANAEFEEDNDPDFDAAEQDYGRFVALYGRGAEGDDEFAFVVSVFRNFVSSDNPQAEPANLDYYYGQFVGATNTVDFLDFRINLDVIDDDTTTEDLSIFMAFVDGGIGRAEASATGGSLEMDTAYVTECWDTSLNQTYFKADVDDGASITNYATEGMPSDCGATFQNSLDDLNIPSLADLDDEMLSALDDVATNGVPTDD